MKPHRGFAPAFLVLCSAWLAMGEAALAEPADRVNDLAAIERLRFDRRTWPSANPSSRPSFESAVPLSALDAKVDDALRKNDALAKRYGRRINAEDLALELLRMIRDTKDPDALRAMFAALENDPRRIADTLARPVLVDRLLRDAFSSDPGIHGRARRSASAALDEARSSNAACPASMECESYEVKYADDGTGVSALLLDLTGGHRDVRTPGLRPAIDGLPLGRWTDLQDRGSAFLTWRIESKQQDSMRVTLASLRKRGFEKWWAVMRSRFDSAAVELIDPGPLPEITALGGCTPDTWSSTRDLTIPRSRSGHSAVWNGNEMIVWGGQEAIFLDDGWKYDPTTDTWTQISSSGAPTARWNHIAVWTGTEMLVWGGYSADDSGFGPMTGGRYNPTTNTWTAMSTSGSPEFRVDPSGVWTGTQLIVWGGQGAFGDFLNDGARYTPATDTWQALPSSGAPLGRTIHKAVWSGTFMIVWGGVGLDDKGQFVAFDTGARYRPSTDSWSSMATSAAVVGRYYHSAIWTGTHMVVWGGYDANGTDLNSGGRYRPSNDTWQTVTTTGAPTGRDGHVAVWTGSRMIVWGGYDSGGLALSGARYDPGADNWQGMSAIGAPQASPTTAVWTGSRMITFGGWRVLGFSHDGGRYDPSTDTWSGTRTSWWPNSRSRHALVWTGNELIVSSGYPNYRPPNLDAGSFEPATATWSPVTATGSPPDRWGPSAVWTGTEMIVWGGGTHSETGSERPTDDGGRYNPALGTWAPMSTSGAATPRMYHSTVWTGMEMIVWGGRGDSAGTRINTGGRYAPSTNSWSPVSLTGAPSARQDAVAAWDGREMLIVSGSGPGASERGGGRYDPDSDTWSKNSASGAPAGNNSGGGFGVWSGHDLFVAFAGPTYMDAMRFDPALDVWTAVPPSDTPMVSGGFVWACGKAVFWGDDSSPPSATGTGRIFDLASNLWSTMSEVGSPSGCEGIKPVGDGTRLMTFGGAGPGNVAGLSDDGGVYCACSAMPPLQSPTLFLDRPTSGDRVWWYLDPAVPSLDVIRGGLGVLRSTQGNFAAATTTCLANDSGSRVIDPLVPASGDGYWYLARPVRATEVGSYDSGSPDQAASRDAGIFASGLGCP